MLKLDFCDKFLAEIDNYFASGLPIRRPNSMNNYGLIVNEIGMEPSITALQHVYTCVNACVSCVYLWNVCLYRMRMCVCDACIHLHVYVRVRYTHTHTIQA